MDSEQETLELQETEDSPDLIGKCLFSTFSTLP